MRSKDKVVVALIAGLGSHNGFCVSTLFSRKKSLIGDSCGQMLSTLALLPALKPCQYGKILLWSKLPLT